jgi:GNAT superfamily N-acetyltransferase
MAEIILIQDMADFLEYNQLIHLIQDQMEYIGSPKSNEQIMDTFKLAFTSENAQLIVLSDNGYPVGFVYFNVSIGMESAGKYIWLNEMHIHSEYRGKGYGTMLFDSLKDWAKQNDVLRIMGMADGSETRTLNFYKNQGCNTYSQEIFSIYLD